MYTSALWTVFFSWLLAHADLPGKAAFLFDFVARHSDFIALIVGFNGADAADAVEVGDTIRKQVCQAC